MEVVGYSRPTVTRAVRELSEADLDVQVDDGYNPTLTARMTAQEYWRYETPSETNLSVDDPPAPIPEGHAPAVEVLIDADIIATESGVPVRALEGVSGCQWGSAIPCIQTMAR